MRFSPYLGVGGRGGLSRGLGHNLLMQFFRLGSSKMENSKTDFFDNLTIQNDQISYAKHVVAPLYAFFTLFGCWGGGRAPKGSRAQPTYAAFPPEELKKWLSLSPLRGALPKAIEFVSYPALRIQICWVARASYSNLLGTPLRIQIC